MGLFGKRGRLFGGPLGGGLFDDEPNVLDQVEMLFIDVEPEGKKQGYDIIGFGWIGSYYYPFNHRCKIYPTS